MRALTERAERVGEAAAGRLRERVALRVREAVPDAQVAVSGEAVRVSGRGVLARLRWVGSLVR